MGGRRILRRRCKLMGGGRGEEEGLRVMTFPFVVFLFFVDGGKGEKNV